MPRGTNLAYPSVIERVLSPKTLSTKTNVALTPSWLSVTEGTKSSE